MINNFDVFQVKDKRQKHQQSDHCIMTALELQASNRFTVYLTTINHNIPLRYAFEEIKTWMSNNNFTKSKILQNKLNNRIFSL